jgi:hypothetical protein
MSLNVIEHHKPSRKRSPPKLTPVLRNRSSSLSPDPQTSSVRVLENISTEFSRCSVSPHKKQAIPTTPPTSSLSVCHRDLSPSLTSPDFHDDLLGGSRASSPPRTATSPLSTPFNQGPTPRSRRANTSPTLSYFSSPLTDYEGSPGTEPPLDRPLPSAQLRSGCAQISPDSELDNNSPPGKNRLHVDAQAPERTQPRQNLEESSAVRYSLRARLPKQQQPYLYDKLAYKQALGSNPDAIVTVVSPRRGADRWSPSQNPLHQGENISPQNDFTHGKKTINRASTSNRSQTHPEFMLPHRQQGDISLSSTDEDTKREAHVFTKEARKLLKEQRRRDRPELNEKVQVKERRPRKFPLQSGQDREVRHSSEPAVGPSRGSSPLMPSGSDISTSRYDDSACSPHHRQDSDESPAQGYIFQ